MIYQIELQSEVIIEMQSAFEWHEEQREGLGFELTNEIESCF